MAAMLRGFIATDTTARATIFALLVCRITQRSRQDDEYEQQETWYYTQRRQYKAKLQPNHLIAYPLRRSVFSYLTFENEKSLFTSLSTLYMYASVTPKTCSDAQSRYSLSLQTRLELLYAKKEYAMCRQGECELNVKLDYENRLPTPKCTRAGKARNTVTQQCGQGHRRQELATK